MKRTWTTRQLITAVIITAAISFCAGMAFAQPSQAVAAALKDRGIGPHTRYVWLSGDSGVTGEHIDFAVNLAISRARTLIPIARVGKLLRLDLRHLAPSDADFVDVAKTWERLAESEPYFLNQKKFVEVRVSVPRYQANDGRWYDFKIIKCHPFSDQCGADAERLFDLTGSRAPIVRADWFNRIILSTLDGGLYYEFRNIRKSTIRGKSDEAVFLEQFGASQSLVEQLRSDQKVALFRSDITGKPRAVLMFRGVGTRVGDNQGLVAITQDVADGDVDPRSDPIRNLLDARFVATEVLAEMPNGLIAFALFNGQGALQLEAPPNVAKDHTIPAPHTARLQAAVSCLSCHSLNRGDDGWKPLRNDVQTLLRGGLAVVGGPDVIDRVAGLYLGDFTKPLRRARDDYSDAITRITAGRSNVQQLSQGVAAGYRAYWLEMVTPAKACNEIGVSVAEKDAVTTLRKLLPPFANGTEDPIVAALKAGIPVNRLQWEPVYADAATRATVSLAATMKQLLDPE